MNTYESAMCNYNENMDIFKGLMKNIVSDFSTQQQPKPRFAVKAYVIPEVSRVMYNFGKKVTEFHYETREDGSKKKIVDKTIPVLATIVYFEDGTKITVINSANDTLILDANGKPTNESKEIGLLYALLKRAYSNVDLDGNVVCNGFGNKLRTMVNEAYDVQKAAAENAAKKAETKAKHEELKANAKPKRPSFAETVVDLRAAVDGMNEAIKMIKSDLAEIHASKA